MFESSIELLDFALRELQSVVEKGENKVVVVLEKLVADTTMENLQKVDKKFELKTITEILREESEFKEYTIKSALDYKFKAHIWLRNQPAPSYYDIIWTLTLLQN